MSMFNRENDGIIEYETRRKVYVCSYFPKLLTTTPTLQLYVYDKKFATWEFTICKDTKIISALRNRWADFGYPVYSRPIKGLDKLMKESNRRHKKSTGGRRWDNVNDTTQNVVFRGYTDESHWTGMVGSLVAYNIR